MAKIRHKGKGRPTKNHHHEPTKRYPMHGGDLDLSGPRKYMAGFDTHKPPKKLAPEEIREAELKMLRLRKPGAERGERGVYKSGSVNRGKVPTMPLEEKLLQTPEEEAMRRYFLNDVSNAIPEEHRHEVKITGRMEIYVRNGGALNDKDLAGILTNPYIVIVRKKDIPSDSGASCDSATESRLRSVIVEFGYKGKSIAELYTVLSSYEKHGIGFKQSAFYELPRPKLNNPSLVMDG